MQPSDQNCVLIENVRVLTNFLRGKPWLDYSSEKHYAYVLNLNQSREKVIYSAKDGVSLGVIKMPFPRNL